MTQTLGNYTIKRFLGSLSGEPVTSPIISKGLPITPTSYSMALGVNDVLSLREILDVDKNFQVAPEINLDLSHNIEFYRVSLVADFFHQKNLKFSSGMISAETGSGPDRMKSQV